MAGGWPTSWNDPEGFRASFVVPTKGRYRGGVRGCRIAKTSPKSRILDFQLGKPSFLWTKSMFLGFSLPFAPSFIAFSARIVAPVQGRCCSQVNGWRISSRGSGKSLTTHCSCNWMSWGRTMVFRRTAGRADVFGTSEL